MDKITADFYVKVNEDYNVVDVIGRNVIFLPFAWQEENEDSIKWYKDIYKPEYRRTE